MNICPSCGKGIATDGAPVGIVESGRVKAPQSLRYTTRERLMAAKSLDDIW